MVRSFGQYFQIQLASRGQVLQLLLAHSRHFARIAIWFEVVSSSIESTPAQYGFSPLRKIVIKSPLAHVVHRSIALLQSPPLAETLMLYNLRCRWVWLQAQPVELLTVDADGSGTATFTKLRASCSQGHQARATIFEMLQEFALLIKLLVVLQENVIAIRRRHISDAI